MKNLLKLSLLAFLLTGSLKVGAAEDFDVKVAQDQLVMVELNKIEKGAILKFQNKRGEVLFKDSLILEDNYRKNLDLEVVPQGVYYLHLEMENSILTTVLTKGENGVEITGKSAQILFKPCYKVDGRKVSLFLTNPEKKNVNFQVFDATGNTVANISNRENVVKKTLDFSNVPSGEYTIYVKLGFHTFIKKVTIA